MSKLARLPLSYKTVSIEKNNEFFIIKGKLGTLNFKINNQIKYDFNEEKKEVQISGENSALVGTNYRILLNSIKNVNEPAIKKIKLVGTGFKCNFDSKTRILTLIVGYSHPATIIVPSLIDIEILKGDTNIHFKCINKEFLGQFINKLCNLKKYNVYTKCGIIDEDKKYRTKERGK